MPTQEERRMLERWKKRLGLQDWRIALHTGMRPDEMTLSDVCGCAEWQEAAKTDRIEIMDPAFYGERIVPFHFEKTLIHELLHLKFSFWCQGTEELEDRVMHQIIEDLDRAFVKEEA